MPTTPVPADRIFRLRLSQGPLTHAVPADSVRLRPATDSPDRHAADRPDLRRPQGEPAIALLIDFPGGRDSCGSRCPICSTAPSSTPHFVVEVDNDGRPTLRFGDDEYGQRPVGATAFTAVYRDRQRARRQHRRRVAGARRPARGGAAVAHHPASPQSAAGPAAAPMPRPSRRCASSRRRHSAPSSSAPSPKRLQAAATKLAEVAGAVASFRLDRQLVHGVRRHRSPRSGRPHHRTRRPHPPGAGVWRSRVRSFSPATSSPATTSKSVRPSMCRWNRVRAVRRAGPFPGRRGGGRARRRSATASSGRQPRLLPPRQLHVRAARVPEPHLAAVEAVQGVLSAFVTIFRRSARPQRRAGAACCPSAPGRSPGSTTTRLQENGVLRITAGGGK